MDRCLHTYDNLQTVSAQTALLQACEHACAHTHTLHPLNYIIPAKAKYVSTMKQGHFEHCYLPVSPQTRPLGASSASCHHGGRHRDRWSCSSHGSGESSPIFGMFSSALVLSHLKHILGKKEKMLVRLKAQSNRLQNNTSNSKLPESVNVIKIPGWKDRFCLRYLLQNQLITVAHEGYSWDI